MSLLFNPLSAEFRADPYPHLARQRREAPFVFAEPPGIWLVTRHADATAILRSDAFSARRGLLDRIAAAMPDGRVPAFVERAMSSMLMRDPPDHTRLRTLVNAAFSPRVVEGLRHRIESIANALVDRMYEQDGFDLISEFSFPLSLTVIAELLGVPADDRDLLHRWSDDLTIIIDGTIALEHLDRLERSMREFDGYLGAVIQQRRRAPRNDLITGLVNARDAGDALTEEELRTTCMLVLAAGHETTTDFLGSAVWTLLRHPEQLARWRRDPALTKSAVEELLRYESPVQFVTRTARRTVNVGGHQIAEGQEVVILIGAANRDPERFEHPDTLDLGRPDCRHLAFGSGAHFCVGASLARLQAQIALPTLFSRMPALRPGTGELAWREGFVLRGLRTLPLTSR